MWSPVFRASHALRRRVPRLSRHAPHLAPSHSPEGSAVRLLTSSPVLPAPPPTAAGASGGTAGGSGGGAGETRCPHCAITFATPADLAHHARHFCFPDAPETVARLFPPGTRVIDRVSGAAGEVLGPSCNPRKAHAAVSVKCLSSGVTSDVEISRLLGSDTAAGAP